MIFCSYHFISSVQIVIPARAIRFSGSSASGDPVSLCVSPRPMTLLQAAWQNQRMALFAAHLSIGRINAIYAFRPFFLDRALKKTL
jgi:hypothetical protein